MLNTNIWMAINCKFASEALGTGFSPTGRGTGGYSRVFDLVYWQMESYGMKCLYKDVHVAKFAFSPDAPPEHQVRISWADFDDDKSPSIKIKVVETTASTLAKNHPWLVKQDASNLCIRTDELHAIPSSVDFLSVCYTAWSELRKRAKIGLDPRARHGFPIRFLEHCRYV